MTRKHFNALAIALKVAHPAFFGEDERDTSEARSAWITAVQGVADVCRQFNGNFDRGRFLDACIPTVVGNTWPGNN